MVRILKSSILSVLSEFISNIWRSTFYFRLYIWFKIWSDIRMVMGIFISMAIGAVLGFGSFFFLLVELSVDVKFLLVGNVCALLATPLLKMWENRSLSCWMYIPMGLMGFIVGFSGVSIVWVFGPLV